MLGFLCGAIVKGLEMNLCVTSSGKGQPDRVTLGKGWSECGGKLKLMIGTRAAMGQGTFGRRVCFKSFITILMTK